jgi:hypothetical protein
MPKDPKRSDAQTRAHPPRQARKRIMASDGRRQTADGRRQTADGRRQTADGRRQTADGYAKRFRYTHTIKDYGRLIGWLPEVVRSALMTE